MPLDATATAPRPFTPSRQQAAFLDALKGTDNHLILEARAGSGKSTTCREGAWTLGRRPSLYCCFNKSIAEDFQRDLPRTCRAATLHSLGFRLLREHCRAKGLGEVRVDKSGSKVKDAAHEVFPGDDRESAAARAALARVVSNCKNRLAPTHVDDLDPAADAWGIEIPANRREEVLEAVAPVMMALSNNPTVADFDDMIWLPVTLGATNANPPAVLFVDEAQDLNLCQHALLDQINPEGRIVAIGDRWQSIYGFRGADANSIPRLIQRLGWDNTGRGVTSHPLTITRRCPRSVVELARKIVPDLEAAPTAPDGMVETLEADDWPLLATPGAMILCRTNAPLVSACYTLWRSGQAAQIQGREIGADLSAFVLSRRASSVADLLAKVDAHEAREIARMSKRPDPPADAIQALRDKCDCVRAIAAGLERVDQVMARIGAMFTDLTDANSVTLSSIHRSKGLERDRVIIIRPDLIPGPWARSREDRRQELNLAYVAATRAKRHLVFCGDLPAVFT